MILSRRKLLAGGAGALALAAGGGASLVEAARRHGVESRTRAGLAFGTTVALTFAGPDPETLDAAIRAGFAEIRASVTFTFCATRSATRSKLRARAERAAGGSPPAAA